METSTRIIEITLVKYIYRGYHIEQDSKRVGWDLFYKGYYIRHYNSIDKAVDCVVSGRRLVADSGYVKNTSDGIVCKAEADE